MDIRIDGDELDRLRRSVAAAPRIIREELTTGVQRAGLAVQAESQRAARVDTGTMRRSMTTKVEPFSDGVRALVGSNLPYAAVMDRGRAAGGPMPPRGSLLGWMRRHGIDEQAE
ncbi:MAG: HK97 gp10 family phage protein, partial [Thermomicrobiales bacterium]